MAHVLQSVLVSLNIANVLLHSIGIYLLVKIQQRNSGNIQTVYVINLSVCEAIMNFLELLRRIPSFFTIRADVESTISVVNEYIHIVMFTGISFVFYWVMIFLTLDRLLDILLNIRYPIYWNETKTKNLLGGTWFLGVMLCVTVSMLYYSIGFDWEDAFFKYFYPAISIGFIGLAIVTYGFIFKRYRRTRTNPVCFYNNPIATNQNFNTIDTTTSNRQPNAWTVFRKSRFYISVLLILSFIFFMLIPDMTYLLYGIIHKKKDEVLVAACWISYAISNCVDAIIYIFLQADVRKLLWMKIRQFNPFRKSANMQFPIVFFHDKTEFQNFKSCSEVVRVVSLTVVNNRYHSIQQYIKSEERETINCYAN